MIPVIHHSSIDLKSARESQSKRVCSRCAQISRSVSLWFVVGDLYVGAFVQEQVARIAHSPLFSFRFIPFGHERQRKGAHCSIAY